MSIAKTQAQQEANFANIRIIKARFAKDGQAFEDCVFNNDTLEIIIDDPRYRHTKTYKNLKHYDDASSLEKKMEKVNEKTIEMHANISQQLDKEKELIDKLKGSELNAMIRENAAPENNFDIKPNTEFYPEAEAHEQQIKDDAVNEPTVIQEDEKPLNLTQFKSPGVGIYGGTRNEDMEIYERIHSHKLGEKPKDEEKNEKISMEEILSTNPDEVDKNENPAYNMLVKKRNYQQVVPKN